MTKGNHVTWCLVGGLFGNRCETNKQTNNQILLHSIPVNSAEHSGLNSGMPKFHWNKRHQNEKKIAGLPAKFYSTRFRQNDQIPAGIRGALIRPPNFLILVSSCICLD